MVAIRGLHLAHGAGYGIVVVSSEQRDSLGESVGQQIIERIQRRSRQGVDTERVLTGDGQLGVAVVEQSAAQQPRLDAKVIASERILDGDSQMLAALKSSSFPGLPSCLRVRRRVARADRPPKQDCVSSSSFTLPPPNQRGNFGSPMRSRWLGTSNLSAREPGDIWGYAGCIERGDLDKRLTGFGDDNGFTFLAARSTSRESCVFSLREY